MNTGNTPGELQKILVENGLEPVYFASSAGDYSNNFRILGRIYNLITKKFGKRMGYVAKKS